jgi:RND family efflux transporter MFP subunit
MRSILVGALAGWLLVGCGGAPSEEPATPDETPPVQVSATGISVADTAVIASGPALSGTLVAHRSAQLRPQVNGTILAMLAREGQSVAAGQLLAVLDTMVLADQARSARLAVRSAELAYETAKRNQARSEQLHQAGAIADREVESSRDQAAAAQANLEDIRSRSAAASKQLSNALVRAPFAGVVSEVPMSVGDVVQVGGPTAVAVVVDPTTLELEAGVPAQNLADLKPGALAEFSVSAHPGKLFSGTIARVNPTVDATTGQLRLYMRVPNLNHELAAGLFAEGRVTVTSVRGIAVPFTAIDERTPTPTVKRIRGGKVEVVPVTLGLRDDLAERVQVLSGLSRGDTVLVGGALGTPVGAQVVVSPTDR